jgi:hypothetical protein
MTSNRKPPTLSTEITMQGSRRTLAAWARLFRLNPKKVVAAYTRTHSLPLALAILHNSPKGHRNHRA